MAITNNNKGFMILSFYQLNNLSFKPISTFCVSELLSKIGNGFVKLANYSFVDTILCCNPMLAIV